MKRRLIITSCLILIGFLGLQANGIDGIWEVRETKEIAIIENTADGIRAKLGEQGPWYYYEKVSKREFVDKRGNSYRIESNNQLTWKNRDRSKRIILVRLTANLGKTNINGTPGYQGHSSSTYYGSAPNPGYHNEIGSDDWYIHRESRHSGAYLATKYRKRNQIANFLEGRWFDQYGHQIIKVRRQSRTRIAVKFRKSYHGNAIFIQDRRYPNVFVDRHGHKIVLTDRGDILLDIPGYRNPILRKDLW